MQLINCVLRLKFEKALVSLLKMSCCFPPPHPKQCLHYCVWGGGETSQVKLYSRLACVQKRQTCKFSFVLEGGKGGAAAAAERSVDPSRLDLRIGKILTAKKVSMSGYLPAMGKYSREWISFVNRRWKCTFTNLAKHCLLHLRLNLSDTFYQSSERARKTRMLLADNVLGVTETSGSGY